MYTFLLGIQYIGIVVLLVTLLRVMRQRPSRQQTIMVFLLLSMLLNFVGYLFEMTATTQQEALRAVQVSYLGKPFILLMKSGCQSVWWRFCPCFICPSRCLS